MPHLDRQNQLFSRDFEIKFSLQLSLTVPPSCPCNYSPFARFQSETSHSARQKASCDSTKKKVHNHKNPFRNVVRRSKSQPPKNIGESV